MELVFVVHGQESRLPLDTDELSIGSAPGNDLFLLGVGLSPKHGVVRRREGSIFLLCHEDTQLNGQALPTGREARLQAGDRFCMGSIELIVVAPEAPASSAGDGGVDRASFELLLQTIADLHGHENPVSLLPMIVDRVITLTGADRGLLLVRGQDGLETTVARDRDGELERVVDMSHSIPRRVLETGEPVCIVGDGPGNTEARSESMKEHDLQAILCVPIRSRGSVAGVVYVDSRGDSPEFDGDSRPLLEAFAAQCGLALERARLRRLEVEERRRLEVENAALRAEPDGVQLLTSNPALREILRSVERVAGTEVTLLIDGETGTGKEVVARYAHAKSRRSRGPFVVIDCGAIPDTLLESIVFGHVSGAFTGAGESSPGLVAQAQGGTLLLDEIGELPLALQPKLLRFLQERTYRPVGGDELLRSDARIIACTHRDLGAFVRSGAFREDLYFRLNGFPVTVPPLRRRLEDIEPLARLFLARTRHSMGKDSMTGFTHEALAALRAYSWPGNVRELRNRIERAVVVAEPPFVTVSDLDLAAAPGSTAGLAPLKAARRDASERFEVEYVTEMLRRHRGVVFRAAQESGVSRQMFQRLMAKHGVSRDPFVRPKDSGHP